MNGPPFGFRFKIKINVLPMSSSAIDRKPLAHIPPNFVVFQNLNCDQLLRRPTKYAFHLPNAFPHICFLFLFYFFSCSVPIKTKPCYALAHSQLIRTHTLASVSLFSMSFTHNIDYGTCFQRVGYRLRCVNVSVCLSLSHSLHRISLA